jgi:hypothetical protein
MRGPETGQDLRRDQMTAHSAVAAKTRIPVTVIDSATPLENASTAAWVTAAASSAGRVASASVNELDWTSAAGVWAIWSAVMPAACIAPVVRARLPTCSRLTPTG